MQLCKFPSIEQFRHAVKEVQHCYTFAGLDGKGKPIYDSKKVLPTLKFCGTIKLHGTNAAVGYCDSEQNVWAQSRTTLLSADATDQFGFYSFVQQKNALLKSLCQSIPHAPNDRIYVFGEWCGGSIQKGVALQNLPKMFCVFAVLIVGGCSNNSEKKDGEKAANSSGGNDDDGDGEEEDESCSSTRKWLAEKEVKEIKATEHQIYNIYDFETFSIEIDFNRPDLVKKTLESITERVEKQCPVAAALGIKGTGEGVVWTLDSSQRQDVKQKLTNLRFKVKGDEHAVVKGKEIAPIDTEKQASIAKFVKYAVTENRLKQGIQNVFTKEKPPTLPKTNDFLKWIEADIVKEESDTIADSNLDQKEVLKQVATTARAWFVNHCKTVAAAK